MGRFGVPSARPGGGVTEQPAVFFFFFLKRDTLGKFVGRFGRREIPIDETPIKHI